MDCGLTLQEGSCALPLRVKCTLKEKEERGERGEELWHSILPDFEIKQGNSEQELEVQADYEQEALWNHLLVGREL